MLKKIIQSIVGAVIIVASLPFQTFAYTNNAQTEFDYANATINLKIRVLDEGKRYVDKLNITTASTSSDCGLTLQNSGADEDGHVVYSAKVDISKLKYGCFFPLKLKIIDPADSTFPSGIVSLDSASIASIDETQFTRIMAQAVSFAQRENQKWSADPVAQQKFPSGYSAFKVTINANIDIRADYQQKNLTAFCQSQGLSVGTAFKDIEALVGTTINESYNEIRADYNGAWATDRITSTHVKTITTTPINTIGTPSDTSNIIASSGSNNGTGAVQDLFAEKYWQSALAKYAPSKEDFSPYSNKDKVAFYGKVASIPHKMMLGSYTVYIEDITGKMVQRAISTADGTFYFFPDGLDVGKKYNIVVPNSNYNTKYTFPYNGENYPFFRNYGQSVVYDWKSKEVDVFLEANIIKETSQEVIEQSFMTPGAWAVFIFLGILLWFILYKLWKIKSRENKSGQIKL